MQVLLILILTYNIYFGWIIYEILKFSTVKAFALRIPKNYTIVSLDHFDNTSKSNEKSHNLDIHLRPCHGFQRFIANKFPQVKTEKLKLRCCKNARTRVPYFYTNTSGMHRRKLFDCGKNFCECPVKYHKSNTVHRDIIETKKLVLTRKKRNIAKDISQPNNKVSETWDNWSNWSACSVTCGQGQQVRWRHCLSETCIQGLKKAQLKSCHLKDCGTKSFLGWLGIKPRSNL